MVLLQFGITISLNSVWFIVTLVAMVTYLSFAVIAREESCLAAKLGDDYLRYKASVRRWI